MTPTETPLTTLIKQMREAASRATPGEWRVSVDHHLRSTQVVNNVDQFVSENCYHHKQVDPNSTYIVATQPENIRRVLSALDECREALKFYGVVNNWTTYYKTKEGACMMDVFKAVDNEQIGTHFWCGKTARAVLARHFPEE